LEKEEENWMKKVNLSTTHSPKILQKSCWQLQFSHQDYNLWLSSQAGHILCFDGASKGNPGEAGAGGVLYSPRGQRLLDFSWNLGINSNNMAEAYAIYQGILLVQEQQLNRITIVGDSKNIIRYFSWEPLQRIPSYREL
jgi:hypothetical protein